MLFFCSLFFFFSFFFFNDTATTEIYTLSLHDALPISSSVTWPYTSGSRSPKRLRFGPCRTSTRIGREPFSAGVGSLTVAHWRGSRGGRTAPDPGPHLPPGSNPLRWGPRIPP